MKDKSLDGTKFVNTIGMIPIYFIVNLAVASIAVLYAEANDWEVVKNVTIFVAIIYQAYLIGTGITLEPFMCKARMIGFKATQALYLLILMANLLCN